MLSETCLFFALGSGKTRVRTNGLEDFNEADSVRRQPASSGPFAPLTVPDGVGDESGADRLASGACPPLRFGSADFRDFVCFQRDRSRRARLKLDPAGGIKSLSAHHYFTRQLSRAWG